MAKVGVGIIGTGRRGYALGMTIVELLKETDLEIRALCNRTEKRMEEAKKSIEKKYNDSGTSPSISLYHNYEDLIRDPNVKLIMIISPQYMHKEHTVPALLLEKKVFLDKPIAHNLQDAVDIFKTVKKTNNQMAMGFTRRYEEIWNKTYDLIKKGIIGDIKMMLVRAILPYHIYFHTWHRRMEWSGGAIADKMSHYFDTFNWFSKSSPQRVNAFGGQAVFLPDPSAPKRCSECDRECPYRFGQKDENERPDGMSDFDSSRLEETEIIKRSDNCVWLPGADINDHGIVNICYLNGIKAAVFWSIFGPDTEDQETFEIVGDRGRIVLTRQIGKIDIVGEYGKYNKIINIEKKHLTGSHFGADRELIKKLDKFCKGEKPIATCRDGLVAMQIVDAAHKSIRSGGKLMYI